MYRHQLIIKGEIKLKSPLHIGSGEYGVGDYIEPLGEQVHFVVNDKDNLPYIPASTLKGALRRLCPEEYRNDFFGCPKTNHKGNNDKGKMGGIYFSDSFLVRQDSYKKLVKNMPHCKKGTPVFVSTRTRINRKTGAADQGEGEGGKLFNFEMVSAGVSFAFEWHVLNATEDKKRKINQFLTYITHGDGFCLGNSKSSGNGRLVIPQDCIRMTYISASGQNIEEKFEAIHQDQVHDDLMNKWTCYYELQLNSTGPFLSINHGVARVAKSDDPQIEPLCDQTGKPLLLPTSVKGVLRKRADWIEQQVCDPKKNDHKNKDERDKNSSNDYNPDEIVALTPTQRLFGVTGWRGLLEIEKVECIEKGKELKHTSVAIDRFTGGSLRHALFKTRCFVKPSFKLIFKLRKAITTDGNYTFPNEADKKLLLALIADIEENGLQLGHGISKGFGWFDVKILKGEKGCGWENYFTRKQLGDVSFRISPAILRDDMDKLVNKLKTGNDKAPYNFVHIEDKIIRAPTGGGECHDKPVNGSVSGVLEMRYTAETPLLIGSDIKKNDHIQSVRFGMEQGDYALPGSSLKGMIRSIYEIATYSGIGFMNEDKLTYRVLEKPYTDIIQDTEPDFRGGWLEKKDGQWYLTEADWYRISIEKMISKISHVSSAQKWRSMSLKDKYNALKEIQGDWLNKASFEVPINRIVGTGIAKVDINSCGSQKAKVASIVCAGKAPADARNKITESVFFEKDSAETAQVNQKIIDRFMTAYGEPGSNGEKPGDYLIYWLDRHNKHSMTENNIPRIPVFFKGSVNNVKEMGMTRLMKVAYQNSLKDYLPYNQIPDQDFTQAVFGYVKKEDENEEAKTEALASRVQFSWALLKKEDRPDRNDPSMQKKTVTMCPRPTFWPYYLKRKDGSVTNKSAQMDYNSYKGQVILAGRKRYPVHGETKPLPDPPTESVASKLEFIPAAQDRPLRFEGQIRFHNLHPVEFGALVWAITLGRNPHLRHSLGHSKAYGYGQVKVEILSAKLIGLSRSDMHNCNLDYYVDEFESYMREKAGEDWYNSRSIQSLLNMTNPEIGKALGDRLEYVGDHTVYGLIKRKSQGRGLPEFI